MGVTAFALGSFTANTGTFPAFVLEDRVYDLRRVLPEIRTTGDLFGTWDANLDAVQAVVDDAVALAALPSTPAAELTVMPPVQPVGPIHAAGANYREHILQMSVAHKLGRSDASPEELWAETAVETDERRRSDVE